MPTITLSEARLTALSPRNFAYDIRDAKLRLVFNSISGSAEATIQ